VRHKKQNSLTLFGKRLKAFRQAVDLSQEQVYYATGIGQSHLVKIESGTVNTGISHIALLAEFFGVEDFQLLEYKAPIPDAEFLRKNVSKYLKSKGIDPTVVFKKSLVRLIETKLLSSKFFTTARFAKEIADFLAEKHDAEFNTSHISHVMEVFTKKGLVEKIATDKKSKFQYKKK